MNIETLVKMARDKNPNQHLAKLSIYWSEQKKTGNPVENAVKMRNFQIFRNYSILLSILWVVISILFRTKIKFSSGENPSWWSWIIIVNLFFLVIWIVEHWYPISSNFFSDAKKFIDAISTLEQLVRWPISQWSDKDSIELLASEYLTKLANQVIVAEKVEKREIERAPWKKLDDQMMAWPKRSIFNYEFELLTNILNLPKAKEYYYANKLKVSAEVSDVK